MNVLVLEHMVSHVALVVVLNNRRPYKGLLCVSDALVFAQVCDEEASISATSKCTESDKTAKRIYIVNAEWNIFH